MVKIIYDAVAGTCQNHAIKCSNKICSCKYLKLMNKDISFFYLLQKYQLISYSLLSLIKDHWKINIIGFKIHILQLIIYFP